MSGMSLDDYFKEDDSLRSNKTKATKVKREKAPKNRFKKPQKKKIEKIRTKVIEEDLDKDDVPNNNKIMSLIRIGIWIIILLLIVKGIKVSVNPPRPIIKTEKYIQALSETEIVKGFAEQFVREYLTYNHIELGEYKSRVMKYTADYLSIGNRKGWSEVLESNVWHVKKIDDMNAVVTVFVKVSQGINQTDGIQDGTVENDSNTFLAKTNNTSIGEVDKTNIKELHVKVPIHIQNKNSICISDYPIFITVDDSKKTRIKRLGFDNLKNSTDNTRNEIKDTLENFLNIYDDGTEEQISYYLLDSQDSEDLKGYRGEYKFDTIRTLEVLKISKDETKVLALVEFIVIDNIGTSFEQKYSLLMRKQSTKNDQGEIVSRWYIERVVEQGEKIE